MNRVPKLRFKEFNDEWEEKKLEYITKFSKGKLISKEDITETGIECIRYGELYTTYGEVISEIVSKTNLNIKDLVLSEKNDIIIPSSGETAIDIAKASCVTKSGVALGGDLNILKLNENGIFLSYYLNNKLKYQIASLAQGASVVHLYENHLKKLKVLFPCLEEQEKIADFLSNVDKKISITEEKLNLFNEYKKGIMQKIFNQELRFKDANGNDYPEWEEKKLEEIAEYRRGSFPQPYGLKEWYDEINGKPFVQVYDVDDNFKLKNDTKNKISKKAEEFSVFAEEGTIIVTLQGSIGRVAKMQYSAFIDRTLLIFEKFLFPIDTDYFKYILFLIFDEEKRKAPGGIIKTITKEALSSFDTKLPCLEEQQKIADFLSAIDTKIEKISDELENLKEFKKGLLQQMFV